MGVVTESVSKVFYQRASREIYEKGNILSLLKETYKNLFRIAFIPFIILFITAPIVFSYIFGQEWYEAGRYTQAMVPWLFLTFLTMPVSAIPSVLNRQKSFMYYQVFLLMGRFLSLFVGYYYFENAYLAIILFSLCGVLFNIYLFVYFLFIAKRISASDINYQNGKS